MGKGPRAVATVIDSRSVKAAETVAKATRGYDAGKKINGRKRHLVVDTRGLPLMVMVTPADLHDAAAAKEVLFRLRLMHPEITIVWEGLRTARPALRDSDHLGPITLMTRRLARKRAPAGQGSRHWPADAARRLISQAAASRPRPYFEICRHSRGRGQVTYDHGGRNAYSQ